MTDWAGPISMIADVAVLLIVAAVGYLFRTTSSNAQRIAKLEAAHDAVDVLAQVAAVHERVDAVADGVADQRGEMRQMNRTLGNIHQALIKTPE